MAESTQVSKQETGSVGCDPIGDGEILDCQALHDVLPHGYDPVDEEFGAYDGRHRYVLGTGGNGNLSAVLVSFTVVNEIDPAVTSDSHLPSLRQMVKVIGYGEAGLYGTIEQSQIG